MSVVSIKNLQQFNELINGPKPVVVDFYATWCGPCKFISPVFEGLSKKHDTVQFAKVDIDEAEDVAAEVGIKAMPTFGLFHNGNKVEEVVGADANKLQALVVKLA